MIFELNNIHFNLENIFKNKQELGEESERLYHGVQTEYVNDHSKKTHNIGEMTCCCLWMEGEVACVFL